MKLLRIGVALCLILCLTGCSRFFSDTAGKDATIYYHLPDVVISIDPQTVDTFSDRAVVNALYEGLCRIDADGNLQPGVAERWEHNADYTEYTFYLNKNASWNNGDPVKAADFVFAFQRALSPDTGSKDVHDLFQIRNAKAIWQKQAEADTLGAVAVDDHTLKISLESSDENFPYRTAKAVYMPCNRSFFEQTKGRYGLTYETSCTNGPFDFVNLYSWEERKSMNFCASSTYAGSVEVYPGYVEMTMGETGAYQDSLQALLNGDVDFAQIGGESLDEAAVAGCTVEKIENTTYGILLNSSSGILSIDEIRKDLFSTIDPQRVENLTGEALATHIIPKDVMWGGTLYRDQVEACEMPTYDPNATAGLSELLAENSFDSMESLTILCADDDFSKQIANQLIVSWNEAFGTYFNMLPMSQEELQTRVLSGDYQIALFGFTADTFDAYAFLAQIGAVCSDAQLGKMLETASSAEDFYRAEQFLLDEGLFYPVYLVDSCYAQAPGVQGIYLNRMTSLDFTGALKLKK